VTIASSLRRIWSPVFEEGGYGYLCLREEAMVITYVSGRRL
jgi:hypothetical protein